MQIEYYHLGVPTRVVMAILIKDLSDCEVNWKSALDNPDAITAALQQDLSDGFAKILGPDTEQTLAQARQRWPKGVAVGALGLQFSPGKDPRLTGDSSVCGVNVLCRIHEHQQLPGLPDVLDSFIDRRVSPACVEQGEYVGLKIDVSKAHKRIRVKHGDQGLLMFRWNGSLYHVRSAPSIKNLSHSSLLYDPAAAFNNRSGMKLELRALWRLSISYGPNMAPGRSRWRPKGVHISAN